MGLAYHQGRGIIVPDTLVSQVWLAHINTKNSFQHRCFIIFLPTTWTSPKTCAMGVIATNLRWSTAEVQTRDLISFTFCGGSFTLGCWIVQSNSCIGCESDKSKSDDEECNPAAGHFCDLTALLRVNNCEQITPPDNLYSQRFIDEMIVKQEIFII